MGEAKHGPLTLDVNAVGTTSLGISLSVVHEQTSVAPTGSAPGYTTGNTRGFLTLDLTIIRPRGWW